MSDNENTNFVWAVFDSKDAAEEAAKSLKSWDKADKDIKLGAIGVVYLDDKGKLKTKKMGPRSTGKGALIGAVLGGLVALFAPATLIGGAVAGGLAGGVVGVFSKKGLGLSDDRRLTSRPTSIPVKACSLYWPMTTKLDPPRTISRASAV